MLTLADDSGLEVDALNGEPGIRLLVMQAKGPRMIEDRVAVIQAERHTGKRSAQPGSGCVIAIAQPAAKSSMPAGSVKELSLFLRGGTRDSVMIPYFTFRN